MILIASALWSAGNCWGQGNPTPKATTQLSKTTLVPKHLSKSEIKAEIYALGFKYPDIVYQQYVEESGFGQSRLARENNNLFGMKAISTRPNTSTGTSRGFAKFDNHKDSIYDRLLLELYLGWHKLNRSQYLQKLRTTYCSGCGNNYLQNF